MKNVEILGLLILSGASWAQQCPPGTVGAGCLPPNDPRSPYADRDGPQSVATPRMIWADRWGAIAVDGASGHVGTIAGIENRRKAESLALERCGQNCKIMMAYHNQCAAMAWGDGHYSVNGAATADEASARALQVCKEGGNSCKVVFTECSMAERIQ